MATRGAISIEVLADISRFAASVQRQLNAALRGLRVPAIPIDADTRPLVTSARRAGEDVRATLTRQLSDLRAEAGTLGRGVGTAFAVGAASALSSSVGPVLASAASLFSSIGAAAGSALPAAAGLLTTVKVALIGVGEAFDKVADDQEKFDKATANLSANAKNFFITLRALLPELTAIRDAAQNAAFAGLADDLKLTTRELSGPLKQGLAGVATDLNGLVRRVGEYARSARGAEAVTSIFRATRQVIAELAVPLDRVITKFFDLVDKGTDANRISKTFDELRNTLGPLGSALGNIKRAAESVFEPLAGSGPEVARKLEDVTKKLADFLATAEAQDALKTLRDVLRDLRDVYGELLAMLPGLLPILSSLASGGFGAVLSAVQGLLDVLGPLVDKLGGQEEAWKLIGSAIGIAVVATKAYQAAVVVATAAQIGWTIALTVGAGAVRAWTIASNLAQLSMLLLSTGFLRGSLAVYGFVTAMAVQIGQLALASAGWLRLAVTNAAATLQFTLYSVALRVGRAAVIAWTAAQWLFNAAMAANPIGLVIVAIVALVAALVLAYQKSETFRNIVDAVFKAVGEAAMWLYNNAIKPLVAYWQFAFGVLSSAVQLWWSAATTYFGAIVDAAMWLWNGIKVVFGYVQNGFMAAVNFVTSLPGRIVSAVGNLASVLVNAGSNIIQGLLDGINSKFQKVKDLLGRLTALLPDWKGPANVDREILRDSGRLVMAGFEQGIVDSQASLRRTLAGITAAIPAPVINATQGRAAGGDGASVDAPAGLRVWDQAAGGEPATTVLEIRGDGTEVGTLLVNVLAEAIRVRGGDPVVVLGQKTKQRRMAVTA